MYSFIRIRLFVFFSFIAMAAAAQENNAVDTSEAPIVTVKTTASRFLPIVKTEQVPVRKVPAGAISRLKEDGAYWYADSDPEKKKKPASHNNTLFDLGWFKTLLWLIIVASFIGVVVWYLASSDIQLFRKESKKIEEETGDFGEDIFSVNYEKEIGKAVDAKNYRLAVRLWYLRTLKELAGRNLIEYRHEKTNSEYLAQLLAGRYYAGFFRITRNFEYIWYGQFPLSEEGYLLMQADFVRFKNGLPA